MGNCPPEISKMIKIIYLGGKIIMVDFKFKKSGLFCSRCSFWNSRNQDPYKQGCEEALHRMHSSRFKS